LSVLIVDDENSICRLLAEVLDATGCCCETAVNATEALALLGTRAFDIALVDYKMPGMSGMTLLTEIAESYPATAAIMITAFHDAGVELEALKRGVRAFIRKPFTIAEIKEQVARIREAKSLGNSLGRTDEERKE
jgi:two-component system response regulator AtoC